MRSTELRLRQCVARTAPRPVVESPRVKTPSMRSRVQEPGSLRSRSEGQFLSAGFHPEAHGAFGGDASLPHWDLGRVVSSVKFRHQLTPACRRLLKTAHLGHKPHAYVLLAATRGPNVRTIRLLSYAPTSRLRGRANTARRRRVLRHPARRLVLVCACRPLEVHLRAHTAG